MSAAVKYLTRKVAQAESESAAASEKAKKAKEKLAPAGATKGVPV